MFIITAVIPFDVSHTLLTLRKIVNVLQNKFITRTPETSVWVASLFKALYISELCYQIENKCISSDEDGFINL